MFIVTINAWKCEGDYDRRISNLSRHLSVLRPDLLFVQEVFVAPELDIDTGKRISWALPDHHFIPIAARSKLRRFDERDVVSLSGLCLFIKGEILGSAVLTLPPLPEDPDRVAQLIKVRVDGLVLQIVNLHLTHVRGANPHRVKQLQFILDHIEPGPVIIGGDFNSRPESEPIGFLREAMDEVVVCSEPTGPGGKVIDYIAWRDIDHRGFQTEPLFDGRGTPVVSDHIGVGVHLDLIKTSASQARGTEHGTSGESPWQSAAR